MLSQFDNSENRSIAVETTSECISYISHSQARQPVTLSVQQSVKKYPDRRSSDSATIGQSDSPIVTIILTVVITRAALNILFVFYSVGWIVYSYSAE